MIKRDFEEKCSEQKMGKTKGREPTASFSECSRSKWEGRGAKIQSLRLESSQVFCPTRHKMHPPGKVGSHVVYLVG